MSAQRLPRVILAIVVAGALAAFVWSVAHGRRPLAPVQKQPARTVTEVRAGLLPSSAPTWELVREPSGRTVKRAWASVDDQGELLAVTCSLTVAPKALRQQRLHDMLDGKVVRQKRAAVD